MGIRGYSSPFALGHKALGELFDGTVIVQEKVDGSQFSFGIRNGELLCRSRKVQINLDNPGMFKKAVDTVMALRDKLIPGWTYRGEFLEKPKHNTLRYARVPVGNVILFDIDRGDQDYLDPDELKAEAERLGLECVPLLGVYESQPPIEELQALLENESILGGVKIEGIVIKNHSKYGSDGKVLMGKLVRDDFKETHKVDWKARNPGANSFIDKLILSYATVVRWRKAVQHLEEQGLLQNAPQDIPLLMKEVQKDIYEECGDEIAEALFKYFWKRNISRGVTRGLPEWYKEQLSESA